MENKREIEKQKMKVTDTTIKFLEDFFENYYLRGSDLKIAIGLNYKARVTVCIISGKDNPDFTKILLPQEAVNHIFGVLNSKKDLNRASFKQTFKSAIETKILNSLLSISKKTRESIEQIKSKKETLQGEDNPFLLEQVVIINNLFAVGEKNLTKLVFDEKDLEWLTLLYEKEQDYITKKIEIYKKSGTNVNILRKLNIM